MANLNKLYENPVMQKLQALGGKFQSNNSLNAISNGMMGTMSLILAGSIFTIIATLLSLTGVLQTTDPVYQWLQLPYNMTLGLVSVAVAFGIAYSYSKSLGVGKELANGFVSMFLFLMVASPARSVVLEDGSTLTVLDTSFLGATGLFTAIIMALVVVRIIKFCIDHHVTIKMPDSVPPFLGDSFAALVPLVINIVLWCGLNTLCQSFLGASIPALIIGLLSVPLGALISVPGMFVLGFICMLLWSMGIHGTAITNAIVFPVLMGAYQVNAELVASGAAPVFSAVMLFGALTTVGGTGNVLPLAVCCLRSKSAQLRAVGKAGIVPAIFNISEPMLFGAPIMYNPILAIPFILNGLITMLIIYLGYMIGFFQPGYVLIMTALPVFMQEVLGSMAWQNIFIPIIALVVGYLVYLPFVRIYDKQCLENEQAEAASAGK